MIANAWTILTALLVTTSAVGVPHIKHQYQQGLTRYSLSMVSTGEMRDDLVFAIFNQRLIGSLDGSSVDPKSPWPMQVATRIEELKAITNDLSATTATPVLAPRQTFARPIPLILASQSAQGIGATETAQANVADLERELSAAYTSLNAGDYSGYRRYAPLITLFSADTSRLEAAQGGSQAFRLYAAIRNCFFVDGVLVAAPLASPCRKYSVADLHERKPDLKRSGDARGVIAFASEPNSLLGRGLRSYINLCLAAPGCVAAELLPHIVLMDAFGDAQDVKILLLAVKRYVDGESSESGIETAAVAFFARSPSWQVLTAQIRQLAAADRASLVKLTAQKLAEHIAIAEVDVSTKIFELLDRVLPRSGS